MPTSIACSPGPVPDTVRPTLVFIGLGVALAASMMVGLAVGPYHLAPATILDRLAHRFAGGDGGGTIDIVLFNIRLPRVLAAAFVGAALSAAGATYQTLFRNPLVSPDILGVSTGASLGAVFGILVGLPIVAIELLAFVGGLATVAIVVALSQALRGANDLLVLVLAGIVVGALAGAAISLVKILADPYDQLPAITFWLLGSLTGVKAADVWPTAAIVTLGLVPIVLYRWQIGLLALGDDDARALGVHVGRLRFVAIAAATLVTASVVAISGVIGWVGLMIPHIARLLVGARFDRTLPASALLGAAFLVCVDTVGRTAARIEIPLGVLTATFGGPLFVWILYRRRRAIAP